MNNKAGIIEPTDHDLACGTCKGPITRDLAKPDALLAAEIRTICPHYCTKCDAWYHPACLPAAMVQGSKLLCPNCEGTPTLHAPTFYCGSCGGEATVKCGTEWPRFDCMKCGSSTSLAVTKDAVGVEFAWLLVAGLLSAAAFIASRTQGFPQTVIGFTCLLACVFALPFALLAVAGVLSGLLQAFTPGGGKAVPLFTWKGGVTGLTLAQFREFKGMPGLRRFVKIYLWLAVNSLIASVVTLVAFAGLYVLMEFARNNHHR